MHFSLLQKIPAFRYFLTGYEKKFQLYYAMGPHLHDYLKEMNQEVFSKYDVMSVAEGAGNSFEDAHQLVDADRGELNMAYAFEGVDIAKPEGYSLFILKKYSAGGIVHLPAMAGSPFFFLITIRPGWLAVLEMTIRNSENIPPKCSRLF